MNKRKAQRMKNIGVGSYTIDDCAVAERCTSYCNFKGESTEGESTPQTYESCCRASEKMWAEAVSSIELKAI